MPDSKVIADKWVDILPPATPTMDNIYWWLLLCALACGIVLFYFWQTRPKQRALRALRRGKKWLHSNPKELIYVVRHALCIAARASHLRKISIPDNSYKAWQQYNQTLSRFGFQKSAITAKDVEPLLYEAKRWIRVLA